MCQRYSNFFLQEHKMLAQDVYLFIFFWRRFNTFFERYGRQMDVKIMCLLGKTIYKVESFDE